MFFEKKIKESLEKKSKKVLRDNWSDHAGFGYTIPAKAIYPFQWNWDTAFHVYGYRHYDYGKAIDEIRSLFKGQWRNGFLPHVIFHKDAEYSAGPDFWKSHEVSDQATTQVRTSGITQPPYITIAIYDLIKKIQKSDPNRAQNLIREFYPKLYNLHSYLAEHRDPENTGLITIYHPWESGTDNSPRFDEALENVQSDETIEYIRNDLNTVDEDHRPTKENYDKYIYLASKLKEYRYDDGLIQKHHDFLVKDIFFSTIFYEANLRLRKMAAYLKQPTSEIDNWLHNFEHSISSQKYFNHRTGLYFDFDLRQNAKLESQTFANFFPWLTNCFSPKEFTEFQKSFKSKYDFFAGKEFESLLYSTSKSDKNFDSEKYWRGPIWININWIYWRMLKGKCEYKKADKVKKQIIKLMRQDPISEYYSADNKKPIGSENFSWSAALLIDLLNSQ
jgi:hypothetical protein